MTEFNIKQLAEMAGMPDTVPFDTLVKFANIVQLDTRSDLALFNHDKYTKELALWDKRVNVLESRVQVDHHTVQRLVDVLIANGIDMSLAGAMPGMQPRRKSRRERQAAQPQSHDVGMPGAGEVQV